jgi:hypothetical protein
LRIGGPARPIHGPLDAPHLLPWLDDGGAELLKSGLVVGHGSDIAGTDIQPDDAPSRLSAERRQAFLDELDVPALTTTHFTANDAGILGWRLEGFDLPFIVRIDECRNHTAGEPHGAVAQMMVDLASLPSSELYL